MDAISTAMSGIQTYATWLNVAADNIANADDTAAVTGQVHRTATVQTGSLPATANGTGQGVTTTGITYGPNGMLVQQPGNPVAARQGYVRAADVDLSQQVGTEIIAQRAIQANAATIARAVDVYKSILDMGAPS